MDARTLVPRRKGDILILFLLAVISAVVLNALSHKSYLLIKLSSSAGAYFKVYWSGAEKHWSENHSNSIRINSRKQFYVIPIDAARASYQKLRLDPTSRAKVKMNIKSIQVVGDGVQSVYLPRPIGFDKLQHNDQVGDVHIGRHGLTFTTTGKDPTFVLDLPPANSVTNWFIKVLRVVVATCLLYLLVKLFPALLEQYRFVPWTMLIALVVIAVMAVISRVNAHPDEFVHLAAAEYYMTHYAPPEVCAPDTRNTYSGYGISRLDKSEIAYYVAGRVVQVFNVIPGPNYLKLRFFDVGMFLILTIMAFRGTTFRLAMLPILVTPQAWYLFSYYDSDAFSLFVCMLLVWQIVEPRSSLRQVLRGEYQGRWWIHAGVGLLLASVLFVKQNFYFFILFLVMVGLAYYLTRRAWPRIAQARPLAAAAGVGLVLFGGWTVWHQAVNGFSLAERREACRYETANHWYHPDTPLEKTQVNMYWRAKGIGLDKMLLDTGWGTRLYDSAIGIYGYMEYPNSRTHISIVTGLLGFLAAYLTIAIVIRGDGFARLSLLAAYLALLGLLAGVAWENWNNDYQPQGRYLLAFIPVVGILLHIARRKLNPYLLSIPVLLLSALALYSFLFVALLEIPKA